MKKYSTTRKYLLISLVVLFIFTLMSAAGSWLIETRVIFGTSSKPGSELYVTVPDVCYNSKTGTKYKSVATALNEAANNQTIYVYPDLKDEAGKLYEITETEDLVIKSGVTLCLPYSGTTYKTYGTGTGTENYPDAKPATYRKTLLNMRGGADIKVEGTLQIGGHCGTLGPNGSYAEINLGDDSSITVTGRMDCYGYIKEETLVNGNLGNNKGIYDNSFDSERYLEVTSTGTVYTAFAAYDVPGSGNGVKSLNDNNICFTNEFDFPSLQTYSKFIYNSKLYATAYINVANQAKELDITILSPSTNSAAMFYHIGGGEICIEHCPTKTNTQASDITIIYSKANLKLGYLYISDTGITVDSRKMFLPISYKLNLYLDGEFDTNGNNIKFLPDSRCVVLENGTVDISSGVIFYKHDSYASIGEKKYSGKGDAQFINNGKIRVTSKGKLGAYVQTENTKGTAQIDLSAISQDGLSLTSNETASNQNITTIQSSGPFFDEQAEEQRTDYLFKAGVVLTSRSGLNCWEGERFASSYKVSLHVNNLYDNNFFIYSIYTSESETGANPTKLTENQDTTMEFSETVPGDIYVQFVLKRYDTAAFEDRPDLDFVSGKWYKVTSDLNLVVDPIEAVKIQVNTESKSGAGNQYYTVSECKDENGTFTTYHEKFNNTAVLVTKGYYYKVHVEDNWQGTAKTPKYTAPSSKNGQSFTADKAYLADQDYTIYFNFSSGCFVEGTLVMLADGTQRKVEDLISGDSVLVFNHETGEYEAGAMWITLHADWEASLYRIINLQFSNGTTLRIVDSHGLFDRTLQRYVFISETNVNDFIGHEFSSVELVNGEYVDRKVTLKSYYLTEEFVKIYSPISVMNMNVVAEGILTTTPVSYIDEGLYNAFRYDEDMKFNEEAMQADIEEYGLYTYEDFKDLIPYEIFEAAPWKYLKVAVGKGYISWEDILWNVEYLFKNGFASGE